MKTLVRIHITLFIATLLLCSNAVGQTKAKRISSLPLGIKTDSVLTVAGSPSQVLPVARLYYGANQVVLSSDSLIADIRLSNNNIRPIAIHSVADSCLSPNTAVALLRIGMDLDEAYRRAGMPDSIRHGEDWLYGQRHRVEITQGRVTRVETKIKRGAEMLDWVWLNFNDGGLLFMNIAIALVMFGVALRINLNNFKLLVSHPRPVIIGVVSQFVGVPLVTFLLILFIRPAPSLALGMLLVAACPGGNISNFISALARGNIALSVTLSAIATVAAIFMTPLNFSFWGHLYSETSNMIVPIRIDPLEMLKTVLIILGAPTLLGIYIAYRFPKFTSRIVNPIKIGSLVIFLGFIAIALIGNWSYFVQFIHVVVVLVIVHNALCLLAGFGLSRACKLSGRNCRTIAIETGIQNSGLGLALIFNPNLFDGLGGMAMIASIWGIWHIISGFILARIWSMRLPKDAESQHVI